MVSFSRYYRLRPPNWESADTAGCPTDSLGFPSPHFLAVIRLQLFVPPILKVVSIWKWSVFKFWNVLWNVTKVGVLRLIKIILRSSTFDIGARILHNYHWIKPHLNGNTVGPLKVFEPHCFLSYLESAASIFVASREDVTWITLGTSYNVQVVDQDDSSNALMMDCA